MIKTPVKLPSRALPIKKQPTRALHVRHAVTVRVLQKSSQQAGGREAWCRGRLARCGSWRGDVYGADWSRVQRWRCSLVPKAPGEEALPPPWEPQSVLVFSGLGTAPNTAEGHLFTAGCGSPTQTVAETSRPSIWTP